MSVPGAEGPPGSTQHCLAPIMAVSYRCTLINELLLPDFTLVTMVLTVHS